MTKNVDAGAVAESAWKTKTWQTADDTATVVWQKYVWSKVSMYVGQRHSWTTLAIIAELDHTRIRGVFQVLSTKKKQALATRTIASHP